MPRGRGLPIGQQSSNELRFMIFYLPMFPMLALASSFILTPRHPNPEWLVWIGRFSMLGIAVALGYVFSRPRYRELRKRRLGRGSQ